MLLIFIADIGANLIDQGIDGRNEVARLLFVLCEKLADIAVERKQLLAQRHDPVVAKQRADKLRVQVRQSGSVIRILGENAAGAVQRVGNLVSCGAKPNGLVR